jgi:hypothetical protein
VPSVIKLGSFPPGSLVPVRFTVRNPGKRSIEFAISTADPALSLLTRRLVIRSAGEGTVIGAVAVGSIPLGQRSYSIRFETPTPTETKLIVEVVPSLVRLEFVPTDLVFRTAQPGITIHRNLTLNNTGNVFVRANIAVSESWLSVLPTKVMLAPGESSVVKVTARTRKTDYGVRSGQIRVAPTEGESCVAQVRMQLPEPKLEALPVDFGDVRSDRPAYATVSLRNVGKVRVDCTLATDQPWLAVVPNRVNVPVGGEKVVKLRAAISTEQAGPQTASLMVAFAGGQLLSVPVSALCRVTKPILGSIRRQTLGAAAADVPVVRRFHVSNVGDGPLRCTVETDQPWIEILTREFIVGPGKKRRIEFRIHTPTMAQGKNLATIRIRSNGGEADVPLSVIVVDPKPELDVLGDLDLGTLMTEGVATGHLSVRNSGVGMLDLRAKPDDGRVTVTPGELTLAPGPPTKLAVAVSLDGLSGGDYSYGIQFTGNGGAGCANVRFRLPVEQIDAPDLIDLGNQLVGHPTGGAVRLRNTGPDRVTLAVRAEDLWVQPGVDTIEVQPGELIAIPFSMDLRQGFCGPVMTAIWLKGRTVQHKVVIRARASKIELIAIPHMLILGEMSPGEERAVVLQVANKGDLIAEIRDLHISGDLEVWVRRQTVQPGATVPLVGRVKMNARTVGKQVRAAVRLADETVVRFSAQVVRLRVPLIISGLLAVGGVAGGIALGATGSWALGGIVAVFSLIYGGVILALSKLG